MSGAATAPASLELNDLNRDHHSRHSEDGLPPTSTSASLHSAESERHPALIEGVEVPPEGGWNAWMAVACCSVSVFFFSGSVYSFGVIQAKLANDGVGSAATLAFVGSLASSCLSIFAIPNANLIRRYGARKVLIAGGAITGLGQVLAGFATESIPGLFVTFGLISGLGYSMIYLPCSVIPSQYFVRRRGLAYGIVLASGGLGGGVIALAFNVLLESVGSAWCFRILGLATWACVLPAAVAIKERGGARGTAVVEWRLFRDLRFTTIWVASALATFPLMVPPFFLPFYGASIGLSTFASAGLVSGFNLASALGRITFGQLSDYIGPVNALILAMIINALGMLVIWPVSQTLAPLIVFVILGGMTAGAFFSLMPTTVASLTEPAVMASGFGLLVTGWGAGYLLGPPVAGYLLQAYGGPSAGLKSYRPALFYAGSITFASMLMVVGMKWKTTKSLKKRM